MAFDETLANRVRETLQHLPAIEEKRMFSGITFMVNGKMCISVSGDNLMLHLDPAMHDEVLEINGCRPVLMKGREYKGFVYVNEEGFSSEKDYKHWISLALEYNKIAKASPKKKRK